MWLLAGTKDAQIQVVDNLPRYGSYIRKSIAVLHRSRFSCLTAIAGPSI
jgi:hypothetical protein